MVADLSVKDAAQLTVNSAAFQQDAKRLVGLVVKLGDPNVTAYDALRFAVALGDVASKLAGVAGELGEAIPMLGAMISALEIGHSLALAHNRGERAAQAAARERQAWTLYPSGKGGGLVAADLPVAFDELLVTFGTGRPVGYAFVGGGRSLSDGAVMRQALAKDDEAAGATYLKSFMRAGQSLVMAPPDPRTVAFQFGGSLPVARVRPTDTPPPSAIELYLLRVGAERRAQRLKSERAGAGLLQAQMLVAYGAALALSQAPRIDTMSWTGETSYMARRAILACWLDSALNSEPEGVKVRLSLLLGNVRSVTNARYGALTAAKK